MLCFFQRDIEEEGESWDAGGCNERCGEKERKKRGKLRLFKVQWSNPNPSLNTNPNTTRKRPKNRFLSFFLFLLPIVSLSSLSYLSTYVNLISNPNLNSKREGKTIALSLSPFSPSPSTSMHASILTSPLYLSAYLLSTDLHVVLIVSE